MELIDEEGNLFGVVNIIDALVVLVLLAVLVAGAALVMNAGDEPDPANEGPQMEQTHVTLDLGTQPEYIAAAIQAGDEHVPADSGNITITDVHVTPQGGDTHVVVRAAIESTVSDGTITFDGSPVRLGTALSIATETYAVEGQIVAIGTDDTLQRGEETVVVRATLPDAVQQRVTAGDSIIVAGREVGQVNDVAVINETATAESSEVLVETTLTTYLQTDTPQFGGQPVRNGVSITIVTEEYRVQGQINSVNGGLDDAEMIAA